MARHHNRAWSTTFKELRQAREDHVRERLLIGSDPVQRELAQLATERIKVFEFVGIGHLTTADAFLAAQAAARARENRELAREALYDHHQRRNTEPCERSQDPTMADVEELQS
jgi:hypothetical protein